jgi:radical SAM superfamily enzyme YgiQ (UPF0313 family)
MVALLISTYDLGRQPFGLASPAAWLTDAGIDVVCVDLTRERLADAAVASADCVAFYLPMHTATRLALPVIDRVRALNARARVIAYGLYAPLNDALLRERGVSVVLGGEFESELVAAVAGLASGAASDVAGLKSRPTSRPTSGPTSERIPRLQFKTPVRAGLPPLARYATLQVGAERRVVGYTEASRGCKHRCRHCPIVPVYDGVFRVVQPDVVLGDVRAQVASGAQHITFGDPDFFNGPRHAVAIVEALAREFPAVTYDVTIKVEHLLRHADLLPVLRDTGCAFVTTAVESIDDAVLRRLEKGHTRADFERAVEAARHHGITLAPTFVAFTPWTTMQGYVELLQTLDRLALVEQVAPIQLAIRLLVPQGSRLLELPEMREVITHYDPRSLTNVWRHPDPAADALQREIERLVGVQLTANRRSLFERVWAIAHARANAAPPPRRDTGALPRAAVPYLNEPWYC